VAPNPRRRGDMAPRRLKQPIKPLRGWNERFKLIMDPEELVLGLGSKLRQHLYLRVVEWTFSEK
jgi:hypothetical protein